jgi:hypothetical protein
MVTEDAEGLQADSASIERLFNVKTARALGLPPTVLAIANKAIE